MEAISSSVAPVASRPIGLSDALAAGAPMGWTETVAVIRDVAMHLHWSATPQNVPTLSQIYILPNGSVQIEGGRPHPAGPVVGLASLMEQLLDATGCPQQLLDVQKQARANPPVFTSPQALHAALEYFARPGSQDELAAYYRGAANALDQSAKNRELDALKEKTKASQETEKKKAQKPRSRMMLYLALGVVAVTAIGGALFWMRYGGQAPAVMNQSAGAALDAIATTGKDLTAAASTMVSEMIGAPREPTPPPPTPPPAPPVVVPKARPRGTREAARPADVTAAQRAETPVADAPVNSDGVGSPEPEAAVPDIDSRVYGARDIDVKPPELVYQQFPSQYLETVPNAHPGQLDILVLDDGTVGEVRLRPDSNRLQDRMLISAAKAWRFRPAMRAGRPVRYRVMVPITY
jgi:protein TonB